MKIIPVIDVMNGIAVRGIGGHRDRYQPLQSRLTLSHDPSVILRTLRDHFNVDTFYIADLDAILTGSANSCLLAELTEPDVHLIVDAGVRSVDDLRRLNDLGVDSIIIGLETLPGPDTAHEFLQCLDSDRLVISLDLKNGRPLTPLPDWQQQDATTLACTFFDAGYRRMILLDLAAVGTSRGIPTLPNCSDIRRMLPDVELVTGGGVRSMADVRAAEAAGADGLLIASALHDERMTAADLSCIR